MSDNYLYALEREEASDAARYAGSCYRHDYRASSHGGGTCVDCGDTIGEDEL
ncbi:hypothetical protein [Mycobacterium intracellulare]|uniref:hypothetical protein n=1 Tax=Mycobacterium intracellulare TaxID=1767 RepID=UPI001445B0ED|nr:hypothetical protein [Mycobacterium intracellulare]